MPGYVMGAPKNRNTKVNRFYFIDDLKVVQGSEADLKRANSIIGKVSEDMGMRFGISKCAEIVYERGKMVKGEGLDLKEEDKMLKAVFNRERSKTTWKNPVREAEIAVEEVGHILLFEEGKVVLDGKQLNEEPSKVRKMIPQSFKKWWQELLIKEYENKVVKSVIWKEVRTCPEGFSWMQRNLTSQTIARVLRVQEQMVANKGLDRTRGKPVADITCRLCKEAEEGIKHWLNACQYLAKVEYLKRHDQTLRVFYADVLKKYGLEPTERAWFNIPVEKVRESPCSLGDVEHARPQPTQV
ncbi:unnamed protein product [Sphagnum jensenii]|uniref:Reverse transcriptase domain-containing protein n=1 Tax=Sphagnum jensenii TaxID=128206 RepID=A0ABP0VH23_9BRYO